MTAAPRGVAVRCVDVSKIYEGTAAVRSLSLVIEQGTIHALVGANGAGKSTLLGMMSGRTRPTTGRIEVFGNDLVGGRPRDAHAAGIACVYQELSLVPHLNACANVFLGSERVRRGILDDRAMMRRYAELCTMLEVDIDPHTRASDLSVAAGQLIEIMRAVQRGSRLLLLDEPTAALSQRERENLLTLMRRLRGNGTTIVLVTHNLDEVLAVSDTVTVMRNAKIVQSAPARSYTKPGLVKLMVGDMPNFVAQDHARPDGEVLLRIAGCTVGGAITDVSLEVRANEVLGIAGLVGAGRSSLLRAIAGAESTATGRMYLRDNREASWPVSPRKAHRLGISLLPEDRKTQGLILGMSIPDNVTLPRLYPFSRAGLVSSKRQLGFAQERLAAFNLNRTVSRYPVNQLSGGGQQKVAFARAMVVDPEILLVDEPTRGVDVGAKAELLRAIREFAGQGKGVIVTSAETEELLEICDRIMVLSAGRVVGHFDLHQHKPTVREIFDIAFGVEQ
ncbi:sugar ABC transporter ATP-binding protein [Amycolatopsis panacis]|uniref:sugar ABC transporter ATP-binding protein n=1 Tax=Amycolatopsis panacis TaxID=2340917 RepID=UPI001314920D|nr:sugar ABC transporter ATP-binding protein [Amycolatopsis panacis]